MTTQYEEVTDTSGAGGYPGPQPRGTQRVVQPKDTFSDGDGSARFGGGPYSDPSPVEQPDTSGTDGEGSLRDPVFTGYTTNADLMYGVGGAAPNYKAPSPYVPGNIMDTTGTDITGVGYDQNRPMHVTWYYQDQDVYTIGATEPGLLESGDIGLSETPTVVSGSGLIFRDSARLYSVDTSNTTERTESLVVSDERQRLSRTGIATIDSVLLLDELEVPGSEVVTLDGETPVKLIATRITTPQADVKVEWDDGTGVVVLTERVDYYFIEVSSGPEKGFYIAWVDGGALPDGTETVTLTFNHMVENTPLSEGTDYEVEEEGDAANKVTYINFLTVPEGSQVSVTYQVAPRSAHDPIRLVERVDYRVEYSGDQVTITGLPDSQHLGEDVKVFFMAGTLQFLGESEPSALPSPPTNVQAMKTEHYVEVQWGSSYEPMDNDRPEGFLVESSSGSLVFVGSGDNIALIPWLENDRELNEHDSGGPEGVFGTHQDYLFRVYAVNRVGTSAPSDWSTTATSPTSWDQRPGSTIPYKNRINPIYRADGSIVPGTGIGPASDSI